MHAAYIYTTHTNTHTHTHATRALLAASTLLLHLTLLPPYPPRATQPPPPPPPPPSPHTHTFHCGPTHSTHTPTYPPYRSGEWVESAARLLGPKVRLAYIYISSDSVYDVSEVSLGSDGQPLPWLAPSPERPLGNIEEDAVRPRSAAKQRELQRKDSYGHDKLAGEEALRKALTTFHGPTHMSLRLPDVLGARDNTGRFFQYLLWLRLAADGEVKPSYNTLYTPFIHRICTYVHPLYMYVHHIYT